VHIVRSRSASEDRTDEDVPHRSPLSRSSYMLARPHTSDPCLCRLASLGLEDLQPAGEAPDAAQASEYLQPLGELPDLVRAPDDLQPHGEAPDSVQLSEVLQLAAEVPDAVQARADLQSTGAASDKVQAPNNLPLPMRAPAEAGAVVNESLPAELLPPSEEATLDKAPVDLWPPREALEKPLGADGQGEDTKWGAARLQLPWSNAQEIYCEGGACVSQVPRAGAHGADAQGEADASQPLRTDAQGVDVQGVTGVTQPPSVDVQESDAQGGADAPQLPVMDASGVDAQGGADAPQLPGADAQGQREICAALTVPKTQQSRASAAPICKDETSWELGKRRPAAYYGIVDLKYDKRRTPGQRVKLLELGNGRSSRFSGHGKHIASRWQEGYMLRKQIDRSNLVQNKKMMHDICVECSLSHLRPKQVFFPRVYTSDLAKRVTEGLRNVEELGSCAVPVVLKLANRCRSAGVVVVHPGADLKATLRILLSPCEEYLLSHVDSMLQAALTLDPSSMEEHRLHWWSNECPVFVAEQCVVSHPISIERAGESQQYDATMRVGFVLLHNDAGPDMPLMVEFLGGYWKLPAEPITSADVHARCVSKASSGTLPVDSDDLQVVYQELRHALPKIFSFDKNGVEDTMKRYEQNALLFSFALARHAAVKLQSEGKEKLKTLASGPVAPTSKPQTLELLDMAKQRLAGITSKRWEEMAHEEFEVRVVASYIERQLGIVEASSGRWGIAEAHFHRALELHQWNATARHLVGFCKLLKGAPYLAEVSFVVSIGLDPEFKASYVNLGFVALDQADYEKAVSVSAAGLKRHPFAFQCSYNLGLALAFQVLHDLNRAQLGNKQLGSGSLARRSGMELRKAKEQKEQIKTQWSKDDEALLGIMEHFASQMGDATAKLAEWLPLLERSLKGRRGWQLLNYRP